MGLLEEIISTLPDELPPLKVLNIGAFWTIAWADEAGMAITLRGKGYHGTGFPIPEAGDILQIDTPTLVRWALDPSTLRAGIGMAVLNAVLPRCPELETDLNAKDMLLEEGAGRPVAIVGHFPFVPDVRKVADPLWVLEMDPMPGDLSADKAPEVLPKAEVVALTSSAFVNHTIDDLLELCQSARLVVLLGGSTPLSPLLLEKGIALVAGVRFDDPERAIMDISQGATFRQIRGMRLVALAR